MKKLATVVCLVLGMIAGEARATAQNDAAATAQKATPSPTEGTEKSKIDPAKEADIRHLLDVVGTKALVMQMMNTSLQNVKPLLISALPAGDYREKLVDLFFQRFQTRADPQHLINLAISSYDKHFSDEEIKGLLTFYETPLGQKAVHVMPQLVNELQQAGKSWGEDLGKQCMQEVLAEHPEMLQAMQAARKASQTQ